MANDLDRRGLCRRVISRGGKYAHMVDNLCHLPAGHEGKCAEFPFLDHLKQDYPRVAQKIQRDATKTTGAAWKSEEAGPNRVSRWIMLLSDKELLELGIDMSKLQPQVVAKLREKAADYDSCILVAVWLTYLAYQMTSAPSAPEHVKAYLESFFGEMKVGATECVICRVPLDFALFQRARRGKAEIETCHKDPRLHNPINVGFAHRACNIAQGPKTLDEFYDWIEGILRRARPKSFA